ncbi:MAG: hypothetical protein HZA59_05885 [Hydrogenophilales bacterium]|nr:hypothetical protein [Hydrogenophilales bacterium]
MQSTLEQRFPHIAIKLTEVWRDGNQATEYLNALLFKESTRAERQGFTNDTWLELTLLHDILRLEYPPLISSTATDVWAQAVDASPVIS